MQTDASQWTVQEHETHYMRWMQSVTIAALSRLPSKNEAVLSGEAALPLCALSSGIFSASFTRRFESHVDAIAQS